MSARLTGSGSGERIVTDKFRLESVVVNGQISGVR